MVSRFPLCESRRLELAVANRLSADESDQLSRHVQSCSHCQSELEQLAGTDAWWHDARTFLSSTDDLVAALDDDSAADEPALDFLEPADDPALLGKLGSYEIEELVGRGGMGIVLKGRDSVLVRTVAIKVMASPLAISGAGRRRFQREAQAAAAVVHDHIIPIHSVDVSGPVPFLVMPYIAGRSLQDRLDATGPLETKEVLRIAMQTARGLAAAHAQGLVHRDIKPANILLENGVERVRITDFGLARAIDDASQSQSGYIAGTPQYMAPEQARGEGIDARADLFSLGSVMYAMCSGHPPFRAETTLAVLRRICDDTPRDLVQVNPDVPAWLAAIIHRLLAKSPAERYQSAEEVAGLLERWLAHVQQPTVIMPPEAVGKARKPNRRGLVIVASTVAAVLAISALIAWQAGIGTGRAPNAENMAPQARANAPPTAADPAPEPAVSLWIETELRELAQQATVLESRLNQPAEESHTIGQEIGSLDSRLGRLEWELTPRIRLPDPLNSNESFPSTSP
jgi:eukaryotic-like serine/threonine-protein kinase